MSRQHKVRMKRIHLVSNPPSSSSGLPNKLEGLLVVTALSLTVAARPMSAVLVVLAVVLLVVELVIELVMLAVVVLVAGLIFRSCVILAKTISPFGKRCISTKS